MVKHLCIKLVIDKGANSVAAEGDFRRFFIELIFEEMKIEFVLVFLVEFIEEIDIVLLAAEHCYVAGREIIDGLWQVERKSSKNRIHLLIYI